MRLWNSTNEKPLFVFPTVSIEDYDWSRKDASERIWSYLLTIMAFLGFCYLGLSFSAHHLLTWVDFTAPVLWGILGCILIAVCFPLFVFPILFTFTANYPYEPKHSFYEDRADVFTGDSFKGSDHVCFSGKEIEAIRIRRTNFCDRALFEATVQFKPWEYGRRYPVRFAICADGEEDLQPLIDWLRTNQIVPTWDVPEKIQRRS